MTDRDTHSSRVATIADDYVRVIAQASVQIPATGRIAGPLPLAGCCGSDNRHFPMNVHTLLRLGIPGIITACEQNALRLDGDRAAYLRSIATVYRSLRELVEQHACRAAEQAAHDTERSARYGRIADVCHALTARPPESFMEAVQLFWFAYVLRGGSSTIGRLDQHLYPFYRQDLANGAITANEALAVLCELWQRFNDAGMGDTLRSLMLGGQDADWKDATNDLSFLMVDATLTIRKPEPHVSVRLHHNTPRAFMEKLSELILLGHGQGTIYNDEQIIPSLVQHGVPLVSARNYANDGCTEIIIDGESGINFRQMDAVKCLELTLFNGREDTLPGDATGQYHHKDGPARTLETYLTLGYESGDFSHMTTFPEVFEAFMRQYEFQVQQLMTKMYGQIAQNSGNAISSPLIAGTFPQVIETGVPLEQGGFAIECNMIFSGSITTAGDGLAAIRKALFEDPLCTPADLLRALRADFVGYAKLRQALLHAPKFGNDHDAVDRIVADITDRFCKQVSQFRSPSGNPFWPALFNFLFNDHAKTCGATPDGRKWQDPVAENFSPTPGRACSGPTAVLRSIAKCPVAKACGSSIAHVSLSRSMIPCDAHGHTLVRQLLDSACAMGICVLNFAIYDAAVLRRAQADPAQYADVVVRVWGFSARFIDLSRDMQDHIIARVIQG